MHFQTGQDRALWVALFLLLAGGSGWALLSRRAAGPDEVWREGQAALRADQFDRAEAALKRLGRLRAPGPLDWMLRAQVSLARQRDDEALAALAQIPDSAPVAAPARLLAGQVELRRKRAARAEKAFRDALKLDPKLVQAHRELIYIYGVELRRPQLRAEFRALSELVPLTFDNVWHWCLTRNSLWEPVALRAILSGFLQADPDDRSARLALAECLRQLHQIDEAEKTLAPLPAHDPDVRAVRARIALDRGDDEAAERILREGPDDHPELARLRGQFALAHQHGQEALKHFRAARAAEPDNRNTLFGLANALILLNRRAEAEPYLESSRNHDLLGSLMQKVATPQGREDPKLFCQLGAACEAVGRIPEARAWYKLVIARDPLDAEAQRALFRLDDKPAKGDDAPPE